MAQRRNQRLPPICCIDNVEIQRMQRFAIERPCILIAFGNENSGDVSAYSRVHDFQALSFLGILKSCVASGTDSTCFFCPLPDIAGEYVRCRTELQ